MPIPTNNVSGLFPINGIRLASAPAGIRKSGGDDVLLLEIVKGANTAGVFTQNAFRAAPVQVAQQHLRSANPRFLLVNAGNANAGTGHRGLQDARSCCAEVARLTGCEASEVLPFSTGVIGEPLPTDRLFGVLPMVLGDLDSDGWGEAAGAIMTTDTVPKGVSRRLEIDGCAVTITGIAKGAGMIRPDMATMLAFIATDAALPGELLRSCLREAVGNSFNRITVDGDTSTNDACVLVATGAGDLPAPDSRAHPAYQDIAYAVRDVCTELAMAIIRDAEGATRFVTIEVQRAKDTDEALAVAYTIAHSPLVKTALFGGDPNWGRILAAVGRAGVVNLDIDLVQIHLNDVCVARNGGLAADYSEEAGAAVMAGTEILIRVDLARGDAGERVWTSDLSHEYVRINADYRT